MPNKPLNSSVETAKAKWMEAKAEEKKAWDECGLVGANKAVTGYKMDTFEQNSAWQASQRLIDTVPVSVSPDKIHDYIRCAFLAGMNYGLNRAMELLKYDTDSEKSLTQT